MDKAEWYKAVQRFIEAKGIAESNRNLESEFDARTTHVPEIDGWMTVVNMNGRRTHVYKPRIHHTRMETDVSGKL